MAFYNIDYFCSSNGIFHKNKWILLFVFVVGSYVPGLVLTGSFFFLSY